MLTEAFSYDADRPYPEDTAVEIVDSWVPVYSHGIRQAWLDAGCPDPDDVPESAVGNIHALMSFALAELATAYATGLVRDARTHAEALKAVKDEERVPALSGHPEGKHNDY